MNRIDAESETLIPVGTFQNTGQGWWNESDVAQSLRTPKGSGSLEANVIAFKPSHFTRGKDGAPADVTPPLSADADKGDQDTVVCLPILEAGARTGKSTDDPRAGIGIGEPGDPMYTLQGGKQHAIAFQSNMGSQTGAIGIDICPTMLVQKDGGGGMPAVAFTERGREQGRTFECQEELAYALTNPGSGGRTHSRQLCQGMAVRRLTPMECERLQGFPDGYTAITYRSKPAADGPRYKALGNSMAVPVMHWLGRRIQAVEDQA